MSRIVAFASLVSLFLPPALGDEPKQKERSATKLFSAGLDQAKSQHKRVFLLFGSPG